MSQMVHNDATEPSLKDTRSLATKTREALNLAIDARAAVDNQITHARNNGKDYGHLLVWRALYTCRIAELEDKLAKESPVMK